MADWGAYGGTSPLLSSNGDYLAGATANGSANTKGSYSELIASTSYTGYLSVTAAGTAGGGYLTDFAIGGAGSEVDVISNVLCEAQLSRLIPATINSPLIIPSGTRVSARTQSTTGSQAVKAEANIIAAGGTNTPEGLQVCTTYGATTADSGGTGVDPGGSSGTYGSWTQIESSTDYNHKAMCFAVGLRNNATTTTAHFEIQLGLTATPANNIISTQRFWVYDVMDVILPNISLIFPVQIPAGEEIHARAKCSITDATDRLIDVIAYCFT